MKEKKYIGLKSRDELSNELADKYKNRVADCITYIYGNPGCGKTYVLSNVISKLTDSNKIKNKINIYMPDDEKLFLYNSSNKINLTNIETSISLPVKLISHLDIGVSFSKQNSEHQFEQIMSLMKSRFARDILICLPNYSELDSSIKFLIKLLMKNNSLLEQKSKHRLYFLITDSNNKSISDFLTGLPIMTCKLEDYDESDIFEYLRQNHKIILDNDIVQQKLVQIKKICASNLKLVDFLYVDFQEQDLDFFRALDKIIDYRLQQLKRAGVKASITEQSMEDIILTASISLKKFAGKEIAYITNNDIKNVRKGLDIAQKQTIIKKDSDDYYLFICDEIQKQLRKELIKNNRDRYIDYYNYYSTYEQSQYYLRAYYLIAYNNLIDSNAFALLILSYIEAYKFNDISRITAINKLFDKNNNDYKNVYEKIKEFYKSLSGDNTEYSKVKSEYDSLNEMNIELLLKAELTRAFFNYLHKNHILYNSETKQALEQLKQYASNKLCIEKKEYSTEIVLIDESIVRLRIIYDIAPYILDNLNDVDCFEKLYIISTKLSVKLSGTPNDKNIFKYMENVFNRKAFLFINETQCNIYYEKAKKYFYENEIWDEYCITLISEAGTDIVIKNYNKALDLCRKAKEIARAKEITIPQIQKLNNNKLIAQFLKYENKHTSKQCVNYAIKIAKKLKKNLTHIPCATEYVIITNICSLYLYAGDINKYNKYKKYIEKLYGCKNISDIKDNDIDDFYRYYFAWFELYKNITLNKWSKAEKIVDALNGFVPALFKKQEVFWDKKLLAVKNIIHKEKKINSYVFCKNLVPGNRKETQLAAFYCRGLMLSDLQYTTYD